MIKLMDSVFTHIKMEPSTKDIGKKICNMVTEKNHGLMDLNMKVNTTTVRNMDRAIIFGMMVLNMTDNGLIIKLKAMVFISGKMVVSSQDTG